MQDKADKCGCYLTGGLSIISTGGDGAGRMSLVGRITIAFLATQEKKGQCRPMIDNSLLSRAPLLADFYPD